MKKNAGFGIVGVILLIAAILLLGVLAWKAYDTNRTQQAKTTNQSTQTDPNAGYVVIKEWGVRFKPVDGLSGVEYFKPDSVSTDSFTFTTTTLADSAVSCSKSSGNIIAGLITRNTETNPVNGGVLAKIGDYYYQYRGPQATCGASDGLESKTVPNISQSLKSLEPAK